jgi:hypothetical protein
MLARTPSRIVRAVSYDSWSCPQCSFALTIIHSRQGTRVQYDLEDWAHCCSHSNRDTPLACPCVGEHVWAWLSPAEKPAAHATEAPASS